MKYTKIEIERKIERLTSLNDKRKNERTLLTKDINNTKKQIEYWKDILRTKQMKLF